MPTLKKRKRAYKPKFAHYSKSDNAAIYSRWQWKRYSRQYRSENPICAAHSIAGVYVDCTNEGLTAADDLAAVDHLIPISRGGAVYDRRNLATLCPDCHRIKTRIEKTMRFNTKITDFGYIPASPDERKRILTTILDEHSNIE